MRPTEPTHKTASATANRAEIGRYVIAGLINTLVSFLVYALLVTFTPAEYWLANLFATIAGIMCGFVLARTYVFKTIGTTIIQSAPRYLLAIAIQYVVSTAAIGALVHLEVSEIFAYILVLPIAVGISFVLQKYWVFPNSMKSSS